MKILAIDTSCDETAAAVTDNTRIISNIVWSQASAHAKFGGVFPSLAQRMHEERIDWVIKKALGTLTFEDIEAIAVTVGPGLSIALGVGVNKAKELCKKFKKPLIPVNHIEAHILSPLAHSKSSQKPQLQIVSSYGLCLSGKNTLLVKINGVGDYKILADTEDDAIGEALDKAARMLGFGYPGGAVLEKMAKNGNPDSFPLPIPLLGQEKRMIFSYSGIKTSFFRLIDSKKQKDSSFPRKNDIYNLAAVFQDRAIKHIERILSFYLENTNDKLPYLFLGGGVAINLEVRKRLRKIGKKYNFKILTPYSKKLYGDNAGMVGVAAYLNVKEKGVGLKELIDIEKIDRNPRLKITDKLY